MPMKRRPLVLLLIFTFRLEKLFHIKGQLNMNELISTFVNTKSKLAIGLNFKYQPESALFNG